MEETNKARAKEFATNWWQSGILPQAPREAIEDAFLAGVHSVEIELTQLRAKCDRYEQALKVIVYLNCRGAYTSVPNMIARKALASPGEREG